MTSRSTPNYSAAGDASIAIERVVYEGDHRGLAKSRLPGHMRTQKRLVALTQALAHGVQMFEDEAWGVLTALPLDAAVGKVLDIWGSLVGEPRGSLTSDADYRAIIRARILANRCPGDLDSIIEVLSVAAAPAVCIESFNLPPGAYQVQVIRESFMAEARRLRVRRIMADANPGGRGALFVEAVHGGFAPPASCAGGVAGGPLSRII